MTEQDRRRPHIIVNTEAPKIDPVERWKKASAEIVEYPGGRVNLPDGNYYMAGSGRRLLIDGVPVMDTCEGPWADKTVELAFSVDKIKHLPRRHKLKVLERGAGLNIAGSRIVHELMGRGSGEYHVIELNEKVADLADEWKREMDADIVRLRTRIGIRLDIDIFVHRGEAQEVTNRLIFDERKKFNVILSDTYPLTDEEVGINDIQDLGVISRGLYREGVFAFFPYHESFDEVSEDGYVTHEQSSRLRPFFPNRLTGVVDIKPPSGYSYLFDKDGMPVRKLPVVVCTKDEA